jgi:hypothetical protein
VEQESSDPCLTNICTLQEVHNQPNSDESKLKKKRKKHQKGNKNQFTEPPGDSNISCNSSFTADSSSASFLCPIEDDELMTSKSANTSFSAASIPNQNLTITASTQKNGKKSQRNKNNNSRAVVNQETNNEAAEKPSEAPVNEELVMASANSNNENSPSKENECPTINKSLSISDADGLSSLCTSSGPEALISPKNSTRLSLSHYSQQLAAVEVVELEPLSPELNDSEWPALGPAKYLSSNIADGKRPAAIQSPVMVSLTERIIDFKKNSKLAPVVAVPRSYQPRSPP